MMTSETLTADELRILQDAKAKGFYVRSGRRLAVLLVWRSWCRSNGRPEVTIRRGECESVIMLNGKDIERMPNELAESRAAELVASFRTERQGRFAWAS